MAEAIARARGEINKQGIDAILRCATAVAATGSTLDTYELDILLSCLLRFGGDRATYKQQILAVVREQANQTNAGIFAAAAKHLGFDCVDACFVIAAAVATRSYGIDFKEGVALQKLAYALGIGYPNNRYNQLLSQGMLLARS